MLTAQDVLELRFPPAGLFRSGYDADAVDDWLDHVASTLRAYEGLEDGAVELLADDAREAVFRTTRGSSSYAIEQVDVAMAEIVETLAEHEADA